MPANVIGSWFRCFFLFVRYFCSGGKNECGHWNGAESVCRAGVSRERVGTNSFVFFFVLFRKCCDVGRWLPVPSSEQTGRCVRYRYPQQTMGAWGCVIRRKMFSVYWFALCNIGFPMVYHLVSLNSSLVPVRLNHRKDNGSSSK